MGHPLVRGGDRAQYEPFISPLLAVGKSVPRDDKGVGGASIESGLGG
jgi:hypothetical protein